MESNQLITTPTPIKEEPEETLTVQRFKEAYIREGNATKAYLSIHPNVTYGSAAELGSRMLKKVDMSELMEDMGLTDRALLAQVAQGISKSSKKVLKRQLTYQRKPATGTEFVQNKRGQTVLLGTEDITEFEYEDAPDWTARNKFLELAFKLKRKLTGDDKPQKVQTNIADMTLQIVNYANAQEKKEEE